MVSPERPPQDINHTTAPADALATALTDIERRLEIANANENTIERFLQREKLFEERDALLDEMEATLPAQE